MDSGPLVVDGARGPGYRRKKRRDDDSESLEEASSADEGRCCESKGEMSDPVPCEPSSLSENGLVNVC